MPYVYIVIFLPVGLYNDGVEVLDACLHLCGHGVAGPQRYHVHNLALGNGQILRERERERREERVERREGGGEREMRNEEWAKKSCRQLG